MDVGCYACRVVCVVGWYIVACVVRLLLCCWLLLFGDGWDVCCCGCFFIVWGWFLWQLFVVLLFGVVCCLLLVFVVGCCRLLVFDVGVCVVCSLLLGSVQWLLIVGVRCCWFGFV